MHVSGEFFLPACQDLFSLPALSIMSMSTVPLVDAAIKNSLRAVTIIRVGMCALAFFHSARQYLCPAGFRVCMSRVEQFTVVRIDWVPFRFLAAQP